MSESEALRFIEHVARDLVLQSNLRAIHPQGDLEEVVRVGGDAGFEFDADELRAAFLNDWKIRRRFYAAVRDPRQSPASKF